MPGSRIRTIPSDLSSAGSRPSAERTTGDRVAITLWHPGEDDQRVNITVPGYTLETAGWQDPAWTGPSHSIRSKDVAVMIYCRL